MGSQVSAVLVPESLTVQEDKHNVLSQPSISQYLYLDSFASITHSLKKMNLSKVGGRYLSNVKLV